MNISPVSLFKAQNFTAKNPWEGRKMGRLDNSYIFPIGGREPEPETEAVRTPKKTGKKASKTSSEPKTVVTRIHWSNYGGGYLVPIAVEVEEEE